MSRAHRRSCIVPRAVPTCAPKFLSARFGQYLARVIEQNRATGRTINRGFALLNQMARDSVRHPSIRRMLVSGPLEYIVDAPKARALARKRLTPEAQGYLESLCE